MQLTQSVAFTSSPGPMSFCACTLFPLSRALMSGGGALFTGPH